jgi:hypothetical protein
MFKSVFSPCGSWFYQSRHVLMVGGRSFRDQAEVDAMYNANVESQIRYEYNKCVPIDVVQRTDVARDSFMA